MARSHPAARPHSELVELFPDVFFATGSVKMAPLMSFSRNMVVVREGERLVIVNSMRLTDEGLAKLDGLGKVTDVIRLAGFHGMDDPFYKERYDAKVWCLPGAPYKKGFDAAKGSGTSYFEADRELSPDGALPIANAKVIAFSTTPPEALLLLEREGGILVTGDALQNWATTNEHFSFAAKVFMKRMGFIRAHNVGPGWVKATNPNRSEIKAILDLDFDHVLPSHGDAVIGGAREAYRPAVDFVVSR
ncbi:MAG: hypothetical protein AAF721_24440 [Myxococcota bacterium]